jgi:site-specific recombinase
MSRIAEAREALRRWREGRLPRPALDGLLSRADPGAPFEARLQWLAGVIAWVGQTGTAGISGPEAPTPGTRLRHLLNVLDRNPEWKAAVARTVRATVDETDALELFGETGLPSQPAFFAEAVERVWQRVLPTDPSRRDLSRVLLAVFPEVDSADWIETLDAATRARVAEAVAHGAGPGEAEWNAIRRDMPDALVYLVSEVASAGLSTAFRRRLGAVPFRELPFFGLAAAAEQVARASRAGDRAALDLAVEGLFARLDRCRRAMETVHERLDETGVSTRIVYQLERMAAQVRRAELLLAQVHGDDPPRLLPRLVRDTVERARLRELFERNSRLLARKIVERSAETGEHYVARTRADYASVLWSAAGGGLLTAATAWLKLGIGMLHAAPLVEGLLASANYAVSFVGLQLAHFTLATKQPATTAPALARRLARVEEPGGVEAFVDEAFDLLRSQAASVLGNLATVVPTVALVDLGARGFLGRPLLPLAKAETTLASLSLLGPTPIYAALTGVLLFASSLFAGWLHNFFVFHDLENGIGHSPRLVHVLGRARAERVGRSLRENVSGLGGSASLGLLLGMTPALGKALGLPVDVRHVTLSAGFLAASSSALGWESLGSGPFLWAVGGIASMALLNVGVAFSLALLTAMRAQALPSPERSALRRAFWRRVRRHPGDLVTPEETPAAAGR